MACREAKLKDFHFHDLRHTTATRLADAGVRTRGIMAILGHSCIQTSARYTHATDESLRRAVESLVPRENTNRHNSPHSEEQGLTKPPVNQ